MRVISVRTLKTFWEKHESAEQPLKAWYEEAKKAMWKNAGNIKARYPSASFISGNRVVFNIKGNTFRLVVSIKYKF